MRIVLTCWGSYGDLFPYVGLAVRLKALAHEPVVVTSAFHQPVVEAAGVGFRPLSPDVAPDRIDVIERVMDPRRGPEVVIRELIVPAIRRQYEEVADAIRGADLVISHPVTFATPIAAEAAGVRWLSTVLAPLSFFSVTDFPALPNLPQTVHLRKVGTWTGRLMKSLARSATRAWTAPVQALRVEHGLPVRCDPLYEGQFSPHGTLAMFSRVLAEPQPDWPDRTRVTGFVFYNGPNAALTPDLEAFLDRGDPPVVFTLGSSAVGAPGRFYEESVRAAEALGVRAVLLVGRRPDNRPAGSWSSNIFVTEGAPHDLLFPRASAVVHHGGIGTTGQALRSGHPMLVVPFSHDQPDNAYRVHTLGVARVLYPKRYLAARVAAELRTLLTQRTYAERAEVVGRLVGEEDGTAAAAAVIQNSEFRMQNSK